MRLGHVLAEGQGLQYFEPQEYIDNDGNFDPRG